MVGKPNTQEALEMILDQLRGVVRSKISSEDILMVDVPEALTAAEDYDTGIERMEALAFAGALILRLMTEEYYREQEEAAEASAVSQGGRR